MGLPWCLGFVWALLAADPPRPGGDRQLRGLLRAGEGGCGAVRDLSSRMEPGSQMEPGGALQPPST